ncbi:hypothetical protein RRG08_039295 [Elysia crispata]|uniref:Uncharacterized protein n=1 Tax=Elysia crispata TaxID=231223 RepID=A0AAE0Z7K3_9GAST|nr:hypothetical protein RRG08_039295 [Elysia crispata]
MTTVGVDPEKVNRVDALRFPSYNYHYIAFKRKQLRDLINERNRTLPPQFRRVTEERNRQARECRKLEIAAVPGTVCPQAGSVCCHALPPAVPVPCKPDLIARARLKPSDYQRWFHHTTPVVTTRAREQWTEFLNRCPERYQIVLPLEGHGPGKCTPYFDGGYALRYLRPYSTRGQVLERFRERPFPCKLDPTTSTRPYHHLLDPTTINSILPSSNQPSYHLLDPTTINTILLPSTQPYYHQLNATTINSILLSSTRSYHRQPDPISINLKENFNINMQERLGSLQTDGQ